MLNFKQGLERILLLLLEYLFTITIGYPDNCSKKISGLCALKYHMFGFCTCANIKRAPGYKETDPDVQFTDNYLDNWVSVPAIL